jgi:hypothetical protein
VSVGKRSSCLVGARYGRIVERLDDEGHVGDFSASFPAALRSDVAAVAATVPESGLAPAAPFVVCVDEELVSIPYRIYNAELSHDTQQRLSPAQRTVMACMY